LHDRWRNLAGIDSAEVGAGGKSGASASALMPATTTNSMPVTAGFSIVQRDWMRSA